MRKDFKRAGYLLTILIFVLGIAALVISSAANYFSYDNSVVVIGELVSFVAFIALMVICVLSKSNYNYVCVKFADYIIGSRKKEAEYQSNEAQRLKEIQNMRSAADQEREHAVAAALEQGRSEGAQAALRNAAANTASQAPAEQPRSQAVVPQPQPRPMPAYMQPITPNDEILYNEYGEPVMIRRRVRKNREHYDGDVLYDRFGNPVARRAQNIWEIGGQQIQVANPPETAAEAAAPVPQAQPVEQPVGNPLQ